MPAANNVYDVIVSASDGSLTDTQALAVTVANVNEAPGDHLEWRRRIRSIRWPRTRLAVTTVDRDRPRRTAPTYAIAGGADAARFAINASTGALQLHRRAQFRSAGRCRRRTTSTT